LKGQREARRAVWIGFYVQISFTIMIAIAALFMAAESDFAHPHFRALFRILPRITLASMVAYLGSQFYDVWMFQKIRARFPERKFLWVRNTLSTLSSQLIDTLLFCAVAFFGVFSGAVLVEIFITTYLLKLIVALCDTPFIYLLTREKSEKRALT